jgi:tetratricopeptide (TPR) repeat protein
MTPRPELDIKGNFLTHPLAELLAEIGRARLSGSLRVSERERKCIFYFRKGVLVFAVSNSRSSRLFDVILKRNKLSKEDLAKIPNFGNDLELADHLKEKGLLTKEECDRLFAHQIEGIVVDCLSWGSADWIFSPLARAKDGLTFPINVTSLLVEYGRCLPVDKMLGRFRSLDENFRRSGLSEFEIGLTPDEAFVLSRADNEVFTASNLISVSAMAETSALQSIYTLWLGGLLDRSDWQPAFPDDTVALMKSAKLEIKKEAKQTVAAVTASGEMPVVDTVTPSEAEPEKEAVITVEEYLDRVEGADTYYDVLGVDSKADIGELKKAYFALARMFHPDRFHAEGGITFQRIQKAFTELAQAHETLKNVETREIYDYRMRKELLEREKIRLAGASGQSGLQKEQAAENFDHGFSILMDDDAESAIPFFARAVHLDPKNGRYHAYYGKALSFDPEERFKAEAELQTAIKLDPQNPTYRILLAEFFMDFNLLKRAEGELNRLLVIFPGNKEAIALLKTLRS